MFWIILSFLLLIALIVFAFDYKDSLMNWLGRIKIGSAYDDNQWKNQIQAVIIKWLSRGTPKVPLNEDKQFKLIDTVKNIGKVSSVSYWQDAAVLKAANQMSGNDAKESTANLLERYIDIFEGEWKITPERIDCAMLSYEMLESPYIDNKTIEPAMNYVAGMLDNMANNGTIPYNTDCGNIRFVDTVGMICPFLIKYASVYNKTEYVELAMKQIKEYRKLGFSQDCKLPFHCFDTTTGAQLGICGWGRGAAWWGIGIVDSFRALLEMKKFNTEKAILLKLIIEFTDTVKKYQGNNGSFGRILLTSSLEDSSAATMIAYCYSFMWTLTKNDDYRKVTQRVMEHLRGCTRRNGVIDYSQGDTRGIGFYSGSLSVVPAAQGFAVAAMLMGNIL